MPELLISDLKIGFLVKNCIYFTPWMYGQLPTNVFSRCFSEAHLGHASLFLKLPCNPRFVCFQLIEKILGGKSLIRFVFHCFSPPGCEILYFLTSDSDYSPKTEYFASWTCLESQKFVKNDEKSVKSIK